MRSYIPLCPACRRQYCFCRLWLVVLLSTGCCDPWIYGGRDMEDGAVSQVYQPITCDTGTYQVCRGCCVGSLCTNLLGYSVCTRAEDAGVDDAGVGGWGRCTCLSTPPRGLVEAR